nr:MAG TPA: type I neck protein [Caudoviricetes sp.]
MTLAEFNVEGLEELAAAFRRQEQTATETVREMLTAAADEYVKAEKTAAAGYGIRKTGGFISSIKAGAIRQEDTALVIDIVPEGYADHGADYGGGGGGKKRKGKSKQGNVRYATIGFIFEYGTSSIPARPWLTQALKKAEPTAHEKARAIWDNHIDKSF